MSMNKDYFSEVVDVVLERYNFIDNKLWSLINTTNSSKKIRKNVTLINSNDLNSILSHYFSEDVAKFSSLNQQSLSNDVNSIYFLSKIIQDKPKVSWVKCTLNSNKKFNKLTTVNGFKSINFSIKTLRGSFKTWEHFTGNKLEKLNSLLKQLQIFNNEEHYKLVNIKNLFDTLSLIKESQEFDEEMSQYIDIDNIEIVDYLLEYFEPFTEDVTEGLIITDYNTYI